MTRAELEADLRTALRRANLADKFAAGLMDLDPGQFSRQLTGREGDHIWLDRLVFLPPVFWVQFLPLLAARFGMNVESEDRDAAAVVRALEAMTELLPRLVRRRKARAAQEGSAHVG